MVWQVLYFGALALRQYRNAELRESELARALQLAELRLLKSQLNPHFLFNALNAVRALIAEDPAASAGCRDSTGEHAALHAEFRAGRARYRSNRNSRSCRTTSGSSRCVSRNDCSIDCDVTADARRVRIPVMLLQTVVENAIKHGIAELPAGGVLRIHGELRDGALLLEVENPRPVVAPRDTGEGIGLRNAAERLRLLFGGRASLEIDLSQPALATTRIRIPQRA